MENETLNLIMENESIEVLCKLPIFPAENIPVDIAASIMGKDSLFIREAMKRGIIDIGVCYKKEGSSQYDFYISPLKFYQLTGYFYKGIEVEKELANERKIKKKIKYVEILFLQC